MQHGLNRALAPQPPTEESNVSSEEQALYNEFVSRAFLLVYNEKITNDFLTQVQSGEPVAIIGEFSAFIAYRVKTAAAEAQTEIPGEIILAGGAEIVEALVEIAEQAGVAEFTEEQMNGALYAAADKYREMAAGNGELNEQAIAEDVQFFAQAEQSGQLGEMLGSIDQAVQS